MLETNTLSLPSALATAICRVEPSDSDHAIFAPSGDMTGGESNLGCGFQASSVGFGSGGGVGNVSRDAPEAASGLPASAPTRTDTIATATTSQDRRTLCFEVRIRTEAIVRALDEVTGSRSVGSRA